MRPSARKLLSQLVQEAFSYELSLNRPVDPISGSNATIEQNPEAVEKLLNPEEGKRLLEEAYAKITTYAKYEFKTDVGYHGLVNSSAIGGGWLMSMESLETAAEEGSVLSMEDLDDFYHFSKDKPKVTRHTQLPFEQQNLKGIEGELSALYAAIRNLELDDKELALAEKIYSTNKLYVDATAGKFDALKEIDAARYQFYLRMYKHHQDENATFYSVLSDLIKGKGEIVDFTNAFWGWIEAGEKTNDTMAKALAQFKSGHEEVLAPCFELTEKAAARAKLFPFYEQFVSRGKKLFDNSNENNSSSKFEELCEDYVDKSQELANLFIPAGSSIADCREWLKREHAATIDMEFNHREYVKSTDTSFREFYKEYRTFLEALQNFLSIGSNMFGAIACSVRNVRRSKIMLLEIIFKARAGEFTMEGLEEKVPTGHQLSDGEKFAKRVKEGRTTNLSLESINDSDVTLALSQGATVSQEGFLELVRKLFSKKPEKPDQKLERLERESKAWKNPVARALVEGDATELPPKLGERLVKLSEQEFAPCQWQTKEMKPFLDFYIEAANTLVDYDDGFYQELKKADDRKAVEDVLNRARANIKSHIALAKKYKMSIKRSPQYVEVPVKELYLDLTKRFADSVRLAEKAYGKNSYFLVYTTQYYGWFFAIVEDLEAAGFEDFSQDETDKIVAEFSKLDDEFNVLFDWGCSPDYDIRAFLKKGRLALLEAGEAIERGKEITLSMEGFFTDVLNRMRGKKTAPVVTPESTPVRRPDKLGFGYEDASVLAEEFLDQTKHRTGVFDIEKLAEVKFKIPQSLLATPVANRNNILHWFDTNTPESKEQVEAFYKAFEERVVDLDTAVLMVWNTPKYQRLVRLWSQVSKEVSKYPFTNPSQADFKNFIHLWAHNGLAELTKSSLKIDNLGEYPYGDLLSDLCDGGKLPTPLELEKAATGSNPLYAQIGTFNTYRHWATANVIGQENYDCMRLFGKLEDKYCSVEFEWRAVLTDLLVLSWHIGNLSGKRA